MNTPRTNAKQKLKDIIGDEYVAVDFARQLERELTAAREEIKELNDKLDDAVADATNAVNDIIRMKWQRDSLVQVIEAASILIAAKGRHNTMLAYNGLRDALQSLTTTEP